VGPPEVVRMLIEHGADVSVQDRDGWTAMHLVFMEFGFILALSLFPHFVSILSVLTLWIRTYVLFLL
jgi:ankyrin repeat protein